MMTSKKLPLLLALAALGATTMGCTALGQYGALGTPQAGAAGPTAAAAPGATPTEPATATPLGSEQTAAPVASGPESVSVTIRNSCGQTVKVFYGEKPKFGSGTYSSASSNSLMNHTFRPGEQFWIVDDSQNGIANVQISDSTREIEIVGACDRLAAR